MFSYHTLNLLAEARRADMLREAQPQLRPVVPKRKWGSILSCITPGGRRRRGDDSNHCSRPDSLPDETPTR